LARAPARRLKVFQAQFGFFDSVVAAPSQAAALRAWGTHQNLFADGQARITTEPNAVEAALAHPETPLLRAVGSDDVFALKPTGLPKVPDAPKRPSAKSSAVTKLELPPKPLADRTALDAAEASLKRLDDARKREEADLRRRQDDLDQRKSAAQAAYVDGRRVATAAVVDAREAFRKADGED
jgi:hypothetical protein